jgi:hypothetical protein
MAEMNRVPRTRSFARWIAAAALVTSLAGCSSGDPEDVPDVGGSSADDPDAGAAGADDSTPAGSDDSVPGGDGESAISVFDLTVGTCFDDPSFSGEAVEGRISEASEVQCFDPHDAEVYAIVRFTQGEGAAFPGRAAVQEFADEECFDRFEGFVGIPFEESRLDIATLWPTGASWEEGDREATCVVFDINNQKLEGTMDSAEL